MFAPLIAKPKADPGRLTTSVPDRAPGKRPLLLRDHQRAADFTGPKTASDFSWGFGSVSLSRPDQPYPLRVNAFARDEGSPEEPESESPCGDRVAPVDQLASSDCTASESGSCGCSKCSDGPEAAVPMQAAPAAPPAPTYTLISRGSYGQTAANFTRPTCTATAAGGATLTAGAAAPAITVFPNGTYQVTRNDGVVQTATCVRLAAGLALTQTHENSHAAGATNAVAAANTAGALPRNFATMAACTTAATPILATWNASVNAAWNNEITHGPGTNPPTAATFAQEHAAGGCAFV